jgi:hypothetical protein
VLSVALLSKLVKIKIIMPKVQIDQSKLNNIDSIANVISKVAQEILKEKINGPPHAFDSTAML